MKTTQRRKDKTREPDYANLQPGDMVNYLTYGPAMIRKVTSCPRYGKQKYAYFALQQYRGKEKSNNSPYHIILCNSMVKRHALILSLRNPEAEWLTLHMKPCAGTMRENIRQWFYDLEITDETGLVLV